MKRLKGARELLFDGVEAVTDLVQKTHGEVSNRLTDRLSRIDGVEPIARAVNAVQLTGAGANYTAVRLVNRGVGALVRAVTDPLIDEAAERPGAPMRDDGIRGVPWWMDQVEGTLNGFLGSHLTRRSNALDVGMTLRHEGKPFPTERVGELQPDATGRVCVFIHGLSATEWSWMLYASRVWGDPETCYGTKLREDLGYTPLYVRYNSGRRLAENGRALSDLLDTLCESYPVEIEELVLVGHSMGGLVARSAAHHGAGSAWAKRLRHVFCIGSPHQGAPLEKGVHALSTVLRKIPAAAASVPAAVMDVRSDGIKDLRHGYALDEAWEDDEDRIADEETSPMEGVRYYAVSGAITSDPEHPAGRLFGDLLVPVSSATGEATAHRQRIEFHSRQVFPGMNHLQLANHPAVYEMLRACLDPRGDQPPDDGGTQALPLVASTKSMFDEQLDSTSASRLALHSLLSEHRRKQ